MAKKSRRQPATRNSSSGHRSGNAAHSAKDSLASHQSAQELDSLVPAFVRWHREHGILPELPVLEQLTAFFPIYTEISGGAPVTAMDPGLIADLVEVLNERDADFASFFCASLFEYLHFLRHTGRWSGDDENHLILHRVLYRGVLNENVLP
ncbi:hypothetical protein ACFRJ8_16710 [Arthrobacter sp. NPDC056886]|uniref:hypothetical protein n=1 Tax=Arthrobacter sp. NPDC056886 TaxID=3345960 RepID=UPI00366B857D